MAEKAKVKGSSKYYSIFEGTFRRVVTPDTEGAVKRTNKNGRDVYEMVLEALDGYITRMYVYTHAEYKEQLVITLMDKDGLYVIELPLNSGYASSFLTRVENIDFKRPVELRPYEIADKTDAEKKNRFLIPYQAPEGAAEGAKLEKVLPKYTKEQPGDMPQAIKKERKGKPTEWDFTPVVDFLEALVMGKIEPYLKTHEEHIKALARGLKPAEGQATENTGGPSVEPPKEDDLPF